MRTKLFVPFLSLTLGLGLLTALAAPALAKEAGSPAGHAMSGGRRPPPRPTAARAVEGVVNLNTASAEELKLLPGIGPAKVREILARRTTQPFKTVDELTKVKGIGDKMLGRLRPHLAVSGATTLHRAAAPAAK